MSTSSSPVIEPAVHHSSEMHPSCSPVSEPAAHNIPEMSPNTASVVQPAMCHNPESSGDFDMEDIYSVPDDVSRSSHAERFSNRAKSFPGNYENSECAPELFQCDTFDKQFGLESQLNL
eukprot:429224_1